MALPSSGALKFSDIKTEFGGATPPANFRAYLKDVTTGTGYVNGVGAKIDYAPNVPSSGNMEIRDFLGAAKNKLVVTLSTTSVSGSRKYPAGGTATTGGVTASVVSGGSGSYTYQWGFDWNPDSMTLNGGTTATATFSHLITAADNVFSGRAFCTITDTVTGFSNSTGFVDISIASSVNGSLSIGITGAIFSWVPNGSGSTGTYTLTASPSGGTAPYTYSWSRSGSNHTFAGGTSASTTCSHSYGVAAAQTTDVYTCTVTDFYGQASSATVNVTFGCYAALGFATAPSNVSGTGTAPATVTTNNATAAGSGGTGSYTYTWGYSSGTSFSLSPSGGTCSLSKYYGAGASESGTYYCTVSDGVNTPATAYFAAALTASAVKCATPYVTSQGEGYCSASSGSCTAAESVTVACATSGVTFTWTRTSGLHTPSSATGATLNFSKSNTVAIGGATVTSTYTCVASKSGNSNSDPLTVTVTTVHERV